MITKIEIKKNNLGYYFIIYYDSRDTANFISTSYTSTIEVYTALAKFISDGVFDWYFE